ncbi:hypothetical protein SEA_YOSIF_43 [Streptomyces phage Yosif]|uniref:Uncharacterized protein n=1 Tax=Streptomyces phage Yosif TaxID=2201421 RepID=A0A2Z4QBX2_9CAUD|nr:hypothetical protein KGG71_gp43 [Streptomyces phage Yosif]AWY07607.1 hypothetical protein SEA_YOSIF_43 [Streptomyces phage Yosif]
MSDTTETKKTTTRKANPHTAIANDFKDEAEKLSIEGLPLVGGRNPEAGKAFFRNEAKRWHDVNEHRRKDGTLGYDGLLVESLFDALALGLDRGQMVLVGGVLLQAVEAVDGEAK